MTPTRTSGPWRHPIGAGAEECSRDVAVSRRRAVKSRVVIVQPHIREPLLTQVRADNNHPQLARLRRLDTLLNGVAANCQSVGAEFAVVGAA